MRLTAVPLLSLLRKCHSEPQAKNPYSNRFGLFASLRVTGFGVFIICGANSIGMIDSERSEESLPTKQMRPFARLRRAQGDKLVAL